ncbi:hypothetical protein Rsub_12840 [Raphidocelis subcapitata]|uniref:Uncharacterized protein n=1 Tax=Raphidocelis subcapitata TaxID=307507 RepID=A0A2V0PK26_9CHLO|nr:hypothetical protein Rsub_12840 [Raphidocelis subcapitata]|eukprot:GBG00149.1 hypothetical protein Rsub_12840 [Raphidocelis subcapitata]
MRFTILLLAAAAGLLAAQLATAAPMPAPAPAAVTAAAAAPSQESLDAWLMASVPGFNRTRTCQNASSLRQCLNILADTINGNACAMQQQACTQSPGGSCDAQNQACINAAVATWQQQAAAAAAGCAGGGAAPAPSAAAAPAAAKDGKPPAVATGGGRKMAL